MRLQKNAGATHTMKTYLIAAAAAIGFAGLAHAAPVTIDTTGAWNHNQVISTFGLPNSSTYGETFIAPSAESLDSFTFFLKQTTPAPIQFEAYVYAWNGTNATGPILYQSDPQATTARNVVQEFDFTTGGITLTSGDQ